MEARVLITCVILTSYTWGAAYELWRGRSEPLVSRWPAIFMLFSEGSLFLLSTPLATSLPWMKSREVGENVWLTVLNFEALLFSIAIAFILLAMAKERIELMHKTASFLDPLTGIANRRAFMTDAVELARRTSGKSRNAAVLMIDLDQFKAINDTYGHAIGDRILQLFADTAQRQLGPSDLVGRLGGEEFALVLVDVDRSQAIEIAESIRKSFELVAAEVAGKPTAATCSIGVALCEDARFDVSDLLASADRALYTAKERGRNRCELATVEFVLRLDASTPSLRLKGLEAQFAHSSGKEASRVLSRGADQISALLGDHDRGCVGVAAHDVGHDRSIDHPQTFDAAHTQFRIDHRHGIDPHLTGPDGVKYRGHTFLDERREIVVGRHARAG
jgi:diguanylate cyclase (GGDEF)-like protein